MHSIYRYTCFHADCSSLLLQSLISFSATPIVNIKEEFLRAMKFQEIRIPCMISGDPKPNVTWLKDGDDQMTILPGPDVQIRLFEDAMVRVGDILIKP